VWSTGQAAARVAASVGVAAGRRLAPEVAQAAVLGAVGLGRHPWSGEPEQRTGLLQVFAGAVDGPDRVVVMVLAEPLGGTLEALGGGGA
jgi:hypothetical protein